MLAPEPTEENQSEAVEATEAPTQDVESEVVDDIAEKAYAPFTVNRSLSYFQDTIFFANEMNRYHHIDKKLQYSFLINIVRKRKRFSKWIKPELDSDMDVVKEYYGYSNEKARQALTLLSPRQIEELRKKVSKGGRTK